MAIHRRLRSRYLTLGILLVITLLAILNIQTTYTWCKSLLLLATSTTPDTTLHTCLSGDNCALVNLQFTTNNVMNDDDAYGSSSIITLPTSSLHKNITSSGYVVSDSTSNDRRIAAGFIALWAAATAALRGSQDTAISSSSLLGNHLGDDRRPIMFYSSQVLPITTAIVIDACRRYHNVSMYYPN